MEKIKLKVGDIFNFTKVGYLYYRTIYLGKITDDIRLNNVYSIATFIIPKGSEYYENRAGEIVSSSIIYTGKYVKIGNSEE